MNVILGLVEGTKEVLERDENMEKVGQENEEVTAKISLNAIMRGAGANTLKLKGMVRRRVFTILVDIGITHSFLDHQILTKMSAMEALSKPLKVSVTNGT